MRRKRGFRGLRSIRFDSMNGNMKKRILFFEGNVDGTIGGSYYVLLDLVKYLDRSRFEPIVGFHDENRLIERFNQLGIETVIVDPPSPLQGKGLNSLALYRKPANFFKTFLLPAINYSRLMKELKVDILNLNNSITRNHAWMLGAELARVPYITHEMGINESYSRTSRFFGKRMPRVICVSKAICEHMRKKDIDWSSLRVIQNGLDCARYKITRNKDEIRSEFGIPSGAPLVGLVGNIKSWKGQHVLIHAIALLKKRGINAYAMFVGDCSPADQGYLSGLKQLSRELDVSDLVVFTGFQSNPVDFMNAMDVVVHTSVSPEPFGIVLLEAMWLSKPLVSTLTGGPLEIVNQGETGILVNPDDPESLCEALKTMLDNPVRARDMGEAGYRRLEDQFRIERVATETMQEYDEIFSAL